MKFNNGRERRKFEAAWKKLRMEYAAAGMDTEAIEEMYQFDLETFRSERRYAEHTQGMPFQQFDDDGDILPCVGQEKSWADAAKARYYSLVTLRRMGFDPYVMIYERPTAPPITRHLQRWVNNKRIFRTVERFSDYEPVKRLGGDG